MTPYEEAVSEFEEFMNSPEAVARRLELRSQPPFSTWTFYNDGTVTVERPDMVE